MRTKTRVVVAVVSGLLAVVLMALFAASVGRQAEQTRNEALARYGGETVEICVAAKPIARGEAFSERNVETRTWLVDLVPEGAVQDPSALIGATASAAIAANTPICEVDLDGQAESLEVPEGLTAIAIPCTAQTAVGGALVPGTSVDLYQVGTEGATLLVQGARVLQTSAQGSSASSAWVTVAVRPDLIQAVVVAASGQRLYLALPSDKARAEAAGAETPATSAAVGATAEAGAGVTVETQVEAQAPDSADDANGEAEDGVTVEVQAEPPTPDPADGTGGEVEDGVTVDAQAEP